MIRKLRDLRGFLNIFLIIFLMGESKVQGIVKCPGPCTDALSCKQLGGHILGYCVNQKACCDYNHKSWGSCGTTLTDTKISYFRSPKYPDHSSGDLTCNFEIELGISTTGIRIDFLDLTMNNIPNDIFEYAQSSFPICDSDMFFIKGFNNWTPDPRCGNLTGFSFLVEREETQKSLSILMVMSSSKFKWNIRITQISQIEISRLHELMFNKIIDEPTSLKGNLKESRQVSPEPHKMYLSGYPRPAAYPGPGSIMMALMPFPSLMLFTRSFNLNLSSAEPLFFSQDSKDQDTIQPPLPMPRISGGENVDPYSIPWQVSIQSVTPTETNLCGDNRNMSIHICGGSILDEKTILTAAHCFLSSARYPHPTASLDQLKVVVGEVDLCSKEESLFTQEYSIASIILHFNYISTEILNDLAIIQLKDKIEFNQGVRPISLADKGLNLSEITPLLTGWGSYGIQENTTYPSILQKTTDLVLLSPLECITRQKAYLNFNVAEPLLSWKYTGSFEKGICAKGRTPKVEAGYGDSGGPLAALKKIINTSGDPDISGDPVDPDPPPQLIGIVSHMRPDVDSTTNSSFHLDYFVKVSDYEKWILMAILPVHSN